MGDHVVLVQRETAFGAGAVIGFDLDGDGAHEREVHADDGGIFTFAFDAHELKGDRLAWRARPAEGGEWGDAVRVHVVRTAEHSPAGVVPVNCVPGDDPGLEPGICTCSPCPEDDTLIGSSLAGWTRSMTPAAHGVELATGKVRMTLPVTSFATRRLGFDFSLHHTSLVAYDGPWGQGVSHGFNMMLVRTGELAGQVVTPDLRIFDIASEDGVEWVLPTGFHARLRLDAGLGRWIMTHFSGLEVGFFCAPFDRPGYPVSIRDPNRNTMRLEYDASGLLRRIVTDLGQEQTLAFGPAVRLRTFTDHIGRCWRFGHDCMQRLVRIDTPTTEHADIGAGRQVMEADLPHALLTQPRTLSLAYGDDRFPSHVTQVTDPRGAKPNAREYDDSGRVATALINRRPVRFAYGADAPAKLLDAGNTVTRVVDREGNIALHEIHGPAGGPVRGKGRLGLRRRYVLTERGKGNAPLRDDEPEWWEQRWLHDCDCLSPAVVVHPFASTDADRLDFDAQGIPANAPRTLFERNRFRQVTRETHTDGTSSIRTDAAYQDGAFGDDGQFSRPVSRTDPRAFDENPIYAGLDFTHTWAYDACGNRTRHDAPLITRGVDAPQTISESWSFNRFGQPVLHVDANGNRTVHTYHEGRGPPGDINARCSFAGYLASTTVGAHGSADDATDLTTTYLVNALGMVTQRTSPRGFTDETFYNDVQERVRWIAPAVTLRDGTQVRYETRWIHDAAGNCVLERRSNIDVDGSTLANALIDRSRTFDDVNNLLSDRVEVDADAANDLVTRYAYDGNDDRTVTVRPESNRSFQVYDERRLPFRTFIGIGSGARPVDGYPADKRATDLGRVQFIGLFTDDYDARMNHVRRTDPRGNVTRMAYDFHDRRVAEADPNGNGWVKQYDDASYVLTTERGTVDVAGARVTRVLERTYDRFDEVGRRYQRVRDVALEDYRRTAVDPDDGRASSFLARFDPGARTVRTVDANGNATSADHDAADRVIAVTDALGNVRRPTYDEASNIVRLEEEERPGPGAAGAAETYVTTLEYDELDRLVERHIRGLDASIGHATSFAYDSRNNQRLLRDAEGNFTLSTFDDLNRMVLHQRFDGDPFDGTPRERLRLAWTYDRNSRTVEERALADVTDPTSAQVTRRAWDALDRPVRTVCPDSDDPIDGSGDGPDGRFDRVEVFLDGNSNAVRVTDQRGVVVDSEYDPGNRLTAQSVTLPTGVPGVRRRTFAYDALDRVVDASNDHARIDRAYDGLSRVVRETQSIRLDGTGYRSGWEQPVEVRHAWDRQSNRTSCAVLAGPDRDLAVETGYDPLNRPARTAAQYLGSAVRDIARWAYIGPVRVQTKALGNGAVLTRAYDAKRRVASHTWNGPAGLLAGFAYDYDREDNALFERFLDEAGRYDHFRYDDRYQLTGVEYAARFARAPSQPRDRFFHDDVLNRTQAVAGDAVGARAGSLDCYDANRANEYLRIRRDGLTADLAFDGAGNATQLLVRTGRRDAVADVTAAARWDALDRLVDITPEGGPTRHYRYDAFGRRIASLELDDGAIRPQSRRYVYEGWDVIEERTFAARATLSSAPSRLERVYVNGPPLDEPLLVAIDRDGDGALPGDDRVNAPDDDADCEYYFLDNRLGSVMALLDARRADRVLERYRYAAFGGPSVLPVRGRDRRQPRRSHLARRSRRPRGPLKGFGNTRLFTARDFDERTGLYHFRHRWYDPLAGRFLSRDPSGSAQGPNLYQYVWNRAPNATDPTGLWVVCVGVSGTLVYWAGAGIGLFFCYDDCANSAVILVPSWRGGADIGAGLFIVAASGGMRAYLDKTIVDVTGGVGPLSGGVQMGEGNDPVGGHVGVEVSPMPLSGSVGISGSIVLWDDIWQPYPCNRPSPLPPEPVEFAEAPPQWQYGPVWRPTSSDLPLACCCVKLDCGDEEGRYRPVGTSIVGVPAGTRARDCDDRCQERGYNIGYGAQHTGSAQQCLPIATARAVRKYNRGMAHWTP